MPTTINLVVIRSSDIDKSAELYALLGLEFTKQSHGSGPQHYAAKMAGMVFEIYPVQKEREVSIGARIGFRVEDVDAVAERLQQAGAQAGVVGEGLTLGTPRRACRPGWA